MNPPTTGPTVGPIIAGMVIQFIAETSSLRGKLRSRISRPTGVIIAPPKPWITRVANSIGRFVASPHSADPAVKIAIAEQNTMRVPSRSAIQPLTGMNTARLSKYVVITRLSRSGFCPRLFAIAGIDTAIIVEFESLHEKSAADDQRDDDGPPRLPGRVGREADLAQRRRGPGWGSAEVDRAFPAPWSG